MAKKYHISKDGVARECRAASQESCRVTASGSKEHFDSREDAQKFYEKSMSNKVAPTSIKKVAKTSGKKPSPSSNFDEKATAEAQPKKTPQQAFDEGISKIEDSNKDKLSFDKDIENIRDLKREQTRLIIESSKDTILLNDSLIAELTTYPVTERDYEIQANSLQKHIKNMDSIAESMKKSKLFSSKEINEVQSPAYMRKFYLARLNLNRFYENKDNKLKSHRVFHNAKKKASINAHNSEVSRRQVEAIKEFHNQINDVPESYDREKLEKTLKEFFPTYSKIIKLT